MVVSVALPDSLVGASHAGPMRRRPRMLIREPRLATSISPSFLRQTTLLCEINSMENESKSYQ
jgi:hypothetical protein